MISVARKFLFIHVPKTGGNSIQSVLKYYSEDDIVTVADFQDGIERFEIRNKKYDITKHSTLSDYKSVLNPDLYSSLFKFATIRNPWDMMISFYFSPHRGPKDWDRAEFISLVDEVATLRHYICEKPPPENSHSNRGGQPDSSIGRLDEELDFLLKFERLNEDFRLLCDRIGIPYTALPQRNRSDHDYYSKYYDEELKEIIRRKFNEEIRFGRYRFGEG